MTEKALQEVGEFLEILTGIFTDLFQSGFSTVHDSTIKELERAGRKADQYGMETLADLLPQLKDGLEAKRHRLGGRDASLYELYGNLNQYVYLCKKRLENDQAAYQLQQKGD